MAAAGTATVWNEGVGSSAVAEKPTMIALRSLDTQLQLRDELEAAIQTKMRVLRAGLARLRAGHQRGGCATGAAATRAGATATART